MNSEDIVINDLDDDDILNIISSIPLLINHPFITNFVNKRLNNS